MITGKQKRYLRGLANTLKAGIHLGKEGLSQGVVVQLEELLESRELVKGNVLQSSPVKAKEAAAKAAQLTGAEVVQIIGRKFVLYRRSTEDPVIVLPDSSVTE